MNVDALKSVVWLVPALPLLASFLNGLISLLFLAGKKKADLTGTQRMWRNLTGIIGITAVASALVISLLNLVFIYGYKEHHYEISKIYTWIPSGDFQIQFGFYLDGLNSMMMVVVCTISLLVHIFSTGYMKEDDGFHRFFSYLPFFTFSMLGLLMVNNFLLLYVFWEAVGLSSYLLIGFWYGKKYDWGRMLPAEANKKAFVVNRVGDFGFGLGIMFIFVTMLNVGAGEGVSLYDRLNYEHVFEVFEAGEVGSLVTFLIVVLLFMGAMGKSAQIPLHTWLPDAMAGPTPVSALIHAATMVTAGVYLVGRINPLIARSPEAMVVVAIIGVVTAFYGSTIGCTQKDIKAVMAYSTVSQLGYMFFALGVYGWVAAFFHLMTHAFFKGLLFLGSGAIIHSNEEAIHEALHEVEHNAEKWAKRRYPDDPAKAQEVAHELFEAAEHAIEYGVDKNSKDELLRDGLDPQSMDYMGNYHKKMPIVAYSMAIGAAALAGIPLTAGFWSKDEILGKAFALGSDKYNGPLGYIIFGIGLFAALLTAFYSFRMIFSVFWSKEFRMPAAMNRLATIGLEQKAKELGIDNFRASEIVNFVEHNAGENRNEVNVHVPKPSRSMQYPLVFLAFMSIAAGYVGLPNALFFNGINVFDVLMEPVFEPANAILKTKDKDAGTLLILLVVSGIVATTGVLIAFVMYHLRRNTLPARARAISGPLYYLSRYKWYTDEIYDYLIVKPLHLLFKGIWQFDKWVIDGIVNGTGWVTKQTSQILRKTQTGFVSNYALFVAVGLIAIVAIYYLTVGIRF
jgi:NADH-quinone oxidoreductase subunit L